MYLSPTYQVQLLIKSPFAIFVLVSQYVLVCPVSLPVYSLILFLQRLSQFILYPLFESRVLGIRIKGHRIAGTGAWRPYFNGLNLEH